MCVRVLLRKKCVFVCLNDMCESEEYVYVHVCVSVSLHEALLFAPFVGFFLSHLNRKAELEFRCETGKRHEGRMVSECLHLHLLPLSVKGEIRGETRTHLLHSLFPFNSLSHISISVPVRHHCVLIIVLPVNLHSFKSLNLFCMCLMKLRIYQRKSGLRSCLMFTSVLLQQLVLKN